MYTLYRKVITLPILFGDRFVGRIEAVPDRKTGILTVRNIWWEAGVRRTKKLSTAFERAVKDFAKFNDCKEIEIERLLI